MTHLDTGSILAQDKNLVAKTKHASCRPHVAATLLRSMAYLLAQPMSVRMQPLVLLSARSIHRVDAKDEFVQGFKECAISVPTSRQLGIYLSKGIKIAITMQTTSHANSTISPRQLQCSRCTTRLKTKAGRGGEQQ